MTEQRSSPDNRLARLLSPESIAVIGGAEAAAAIRQCRRLGFTGPIWPVHKSRPDIEGLSCYGSVEELPGIPDAAMVAVPRQPTVEIVRNLAKIGAGGAVCYAAGFAEDDDAGDTLQHELAAVAGEMPVIGPNCIGAINYVSGAALWPDEQGGSRVDRGVAVLTQSGNIGQNITMQRRGLPIAQLVTMGNGAVTKLPELITAMAADPTITAIGLHMEGFDSIPALASAAWDAAQHGVAIVALKTGTSTLGARTNDSHTSAMASSDALTDALFDRSGIGRVHDIEGFVETLKFLHTIPLQESFRLASASCSGGEAALLADRAADRGLPMPPFGRDVAAQLYAVLGGHVAIGNPLDYHTYIWTDPVAKQRCFEAFLKSDHDLHALVMDMPRSDCTDRTHWQSTVDAFIGAHRTVPGSAAVISLLPEGIPDALGDRLLGEGIVPLQGLRPALDAVSTAARIGAATGRLRRGEATVPIAGVTSGAAVTSPAGRETLAEHAGKRELADAGVPVPAGRVAHSVDDAVAAACETGFPVVLKAVAPGLTHKTDVGAVRVGLADPDQLRTAGEAMTGLTETFLVESMIEGALAELVIGVIRDPQFGLTLTIGAGGALVEVLQDTVSILFPVTLGEVATALRSLRLWHLLAGTRGGPAADVDAVCRVVVAIAEYAEAKTAGGVALTGLEVNPLLVLPAGSSGYGPQAALAVAADVLITVNEAGRDWVPAAPPARNRSSAPSAREKNQW
jgi:acetyl-CoA synthetase